MPPPNCPARPVKQEAFSLAARVVLGEHEFKPAMKSTCNVIFRQVQNFYHEAKHQAVLRFSVQRAEWVADDSGIRIKLANGKVVSMNDRSPRR